MSSRIIDDSGPKTRPAFKVREQHRHWFIQAVVADRDLEPHAASIGVAAVLVGHSYKDEIFPSVGRIVDLSNLSRSSVFDALNALKLRGYIQVTAGAGRRSSRYLLNWDVALKRIEAFFGASEVQKTGLGLDVPVQKIGPLLDMEAQKTGSSEGFEVRGTGRQEGVAVQNSVPESLKIESSSTKDGFGVEEGGTPALAANLQGNILLPINGERSSEKLLERLGQLGFKRENAQGLLDLVLKTVPAVDVSNALIQLQIDTAKMPVNEVRKAVYVRIEALQASRPKVVASPRRVVASKPVVAKAERPKQPGDETLAAIVDAVSKTKSNSVRLVDVLGAAMEVREKRGHVELEAWFSARPADAGEWVFDLRRLASGADPVRESVSLSATG